MDEGFVVIELIICRELDFIMLASGDVIQNKCGIYGGQNSEKKKQKV